MGRKPVTYTPTEPSFVESNLDRHARLAAEVGAGAKPTGGLVWGLPALPNGDMWADMAGATALLGMPSSTIRARLARTEKYARPIPRPIHCMDMLWFRLSELRAWKETDTRAGDEGAATVPAWTGSAR